MTKQLTIETLTSACADDSFDDGIRIDAELEPIGGPGAPVKPAVYEGGRYQLDKRWATPTDEKPTDVIVIDNVPSQANRLEEALRNHRAAVGVPELLLDLSEIPHLPVHLPRQISSLQFPHRNADAYLKDALLDGANFERTELGKWILDATPWSAGALLAWFPQSLLYGFWQSHLGKKRAQTKHARAWVSEIVGWNPASKETKVMGLKGDPLNLSTDDKVKSDPDDRFNWSIGTHPETAGKNVKTDKLSEMGHGQVPFMRDSEIAPGGVSFARVSQRSTVSFAQLRRIALGGDHSSEANAAARSLLVALGLHAHALAFRRGFALRSGAELNVAKTSAVWLGESGDEEIKLGDARDSLEFLNQARKQAQDLGVPLDGWGREPVMLTPKKSLRNAIESTWPNLED